MAVENTNNLSEKEMITLLEKKGIPVSSNIDSESLSNLYNQVKEMEQDNTNQTSEEPVTITLTPLKEASHVISESLSKSAIKRLQDDLNKMPWGMMADIAEVGLTAAKFLVAGSAAATPQGLAIMAGVTLIMLLRVGGSRAQLSLQNLTSKNPNALAKTTLTTAEALVTDPKEVLMTIEGSGSKLFHDFTTKLSSMAEAVGFHVSLSPMIETLSEKVHSMLTPFSMELKPKGAATSKA